MKKIILCLVLLGSINHFSLPNETDKKTVPSLSWSEQSALNNLYQVSVMDPSFADQRNPDFDYYLTLLEKHIKIIEYKIKTKESGWESTELKMGLLIAGATSIGLFCFWAYSDLHAFFTGTYTKASIPAAMLKVLPSLKFKRAERKKLDLITVKETVVRYKDVFEKYSYADKINALTSSDIQKLDYLGRRIAVDNAKFGIFVAGGLSSFIGTVISCPFIYNAVYYTEYLEKQLKTDKDIYADLLEEKIRRQNVFQKGLTPANPDRAKRLASIEV